MKKRELHGHAWSFCAVIGAGKSQKGRTNFGRRKPVENVGSGAKRTISQAGFTPNLCRYTKRVRYHFVVGEFPGKDTSRATAGPLIRPLKPWPPSGTEPYENPDDAGAMATNELLRRRGRPPSRRQQAGETTRHPRCFVCMSSPPGTRSSDPPDLFLVMGEASREAPAVGS